MASRPSPSVPDPLVAAQRLYAMGAPAAALDALGRASAETQGAEEGLLLRGACLARLRRMEEAVATFSELLAKEPDTYEALTWMAVLKKDPQSPEEAMGFAWRAIELRPDDATGHGALGTLRLSAGQAEEAIAAHRRAVELAPETAEHHHNLALAYRMAHRHGEAMASLREAIALDPRSPQNYLALASILSLFGRAGEAIECLLEGLSHAPDSAPLHSSVAGAFASIHNDEAAERHHRRALERSSEGRRGYAAWLLNQGRFDESNAVFEAMLRDGSDPAHAYYGLMQARRSVDDAFVSEMESLLESGTLRPPSRMFLHYALGRAEERRKAYGPAMAHFDEANRLAQAAYHGGCPVPPSRFAEEHARVSRLEASIRSLAPEGDPTEAPIFIVGMIRSGTTLLDQIVSSHPDVASGGELRFWIEEVQRLVARDAAPSGDDLRVLAEEYVGYARLLAGPEPRFTDKMPLNFALAGVIHAAMPNARFLHIRRNPIDTCLSIWTTFFGQGPAFAYDKGSIVSYYWQYQSTMDDWREILPTERLLELDYEALIADPEPTIRRVVAFCGLPWNDACLRHEENASAINTPSRWQARQPIYTSSVERWRRYEPWLGAFSELREEG